ncbi:trypsin-like peptidase domain-containing protein [Sinorhizobium americanum]|uniref:Probable periplasmic serine endoprotease DegP-like n=1 Tax=Sinorhizobium americanum TaxID=194963 RepID=A0A1L3LZR5_9HYPH|nr:trypsin-like peptidase domain-containing protein [Sinorhizobium americanum]APG95558.1 periplasmic serine endoprotease DegP-like protein [Sinorhizobium americanum]OAP46038.1 serine peptidase [Sinorhizobium americanum]
MASSSAQKGSRAGRLTAVLAALSSVSALSLAALVAEPVAMHATNGAGSTVRAAPNAVQPPSAAEPGDFADIVARVKPAVISVRVEIDAAQQQAAAQDDGGAPDPDDGQGPLVGEGSGFFISADGYAVTNNHVVDHAHSLEVMTSDGRSYEATVVGTDPKTDLALIKVDGRDFPHVRFADQRPRVGNWVIAIGNPYGLGGTVTAGIVSAEGRDIGAGPYDDFIQIDAPINRGNSGGPAFDVNGDVIGVNTAIFSPSGGSVGIGFDIPADTAKAVIAELKAKGHVTRGWLGIKEQQVTPDIAEGLGLKEAKGALVDEADPAGPAGKAGMRSGDLITAVDGATIDDPRELAQKVGAKAPGTSVTVSIVRNGAPMEITLDLATMPEERAAPIEAASDGGAAPSGGQDFGLLLAPASKVAGAAEKGMVVVAIDPKGAAAQHGLEAGDIILDVGGKAVSNARDFRRDLVSLRKEGKLAALLRIQSSGATRFVALPLGHA